MDNFEWSVFGKQIETISIQHPFWFDNISFCKRETEFPMGSERIFSGYFGWLQTESSEHPVFKLTFHEYIIQILNNFAKTF